MIALVLTVFLVLFWAVLGYALLVVTYQKPNLTQNALLAPGVGIAGTLIPVFFINRLGIPVGQFGMLLFITLALASMFVWWRSRAIFPFRRVLPFALILLLALLLVARPMLEFGFDWVGFGNDDYANYVFNAHRLLTHGYFDSPLPSDIMSGQQADIFYWLLYTSGGSRVGADLLLAWVSSFTGLSTPHVFMSVISAFHLCLISAAGALVYQTRRYRRAALVTCIMLSFSALLTVGLMYQLIAQVLGMALACVVAAVLFRPFTHLRRNTALRLGILIACVFGALMISYPEIMPFVGLGFLFFIGLGILRRQPVIAWRPLFYVTSIAAILLLLILNFYIPDFVTFLRGQFLQGVTGRAVVLMPYYLIPSGLSAFWGFHAFYVLLPEPLLSSGILIGAVLLAIGVCFVLLQSWKRTPIALIALAMCFVGAYLFVRRSDFGLFKLTMFIQPFLIGALVISWLELTRKWRFFLPFVPLLLIAGVGLVTQIYYVEISRGYEYSGPNDIPRASSHHILTEFSDLIDNNPAPSYLSDSNHSTLYKLQLIDLYNASVEYPSAAEISILNTRFIRLLGKDAVQPETIPVNAPNFYRVAWELYQAFKQTYTLRQFDLFNGGTSPETNAFYTYDFANTASEDEQVALLTTPFQSRLNFARLGWFQDRFYIARPLNDVENYLVFVESKLAQQYYIPLFYDLSDETTTATGSLFRVQPDYFYPQSQMIGTGRYLLFEVLNPSPAVRLRLNYTSSLKNDREFVLPPAVTIGADRYPFPLMGRGSARVFTPPLVPQEIDGRYYVMLDMGEDGQQYTSTRTGIMALYGTDINLDQRRIVGYARDISVISEAEYSTLNAPGSLSAFPADLNNENLEYSGIFEDGWLSEASYFCLAQHQSETPLRIQGHNLELDDPAFTQGLTVLVDGEQVLQETLPLGDFELNIPSSTPGRHCVELRFTNTRRLPYGNNRPFAAQLKFIGYP